MTPLDGHAITMLRHDITITLLLPDCHTVCMSLQGGVMAAKFCVDSPFALAVGGQKNGFQLVDVKGLIAGQSIYISSACMQYAYTRA